MPVKEHLGDIFESPIDILAHVCNCQNTMGAGLALEIKNRFPEAYDADLATIRGDEKKLGTVSYAKIKKPAGQLRYIANVYGQFFYGHNKRHLDYNAFYNGFESLRNRLIDNKNNHFVVGVSSGIGSTNAKGDPRIIRVMFDVLFSESPITLLICKKD